MLVAQACEISGLDRSIRMPAPDLGEHTTWILQSIGCSKDDMDALRAQKIIREEWR